MTDNNGGDLGAFLSGFLVGGLVGAAVSLLMAPQSGEQTRTQIADKGIELRGRADAELEQFRVRAEKTLEDVRKQAEDLQSKSMETVDGARSRVTSAIEQGKEAAQQVRKDLTKDKSEAT